MGAALSSRRDNIPASPHWPLVSEYLSHTIRSLDECANIFLCSYLPDDKQEGARHRSLPGMQPGSAFPRYLDADQFEQVFGIIVADPEPHFQFFQAVSGSVACAPLAFCTLAILANADIHAKLKFLLKLYATNEHGHLPTDRKRQLMRDILIVLPRAMHLTEPVESEVVSDLEKMLLGSSDEGTRAYETYRDVYDICFSTARVSGFLHELQSAVEDMRRLRDKVVADKRRVVDSEEAVQATTTTTRGSGCLKLLNRGATMLQIATESVLWALRAYQFPWFWRHEEVVLNSRMTVKQALSAMKLADNAERALVIESAERPKPIGLLTLDDFVTFLLSFIPADACPSSSIGDYMRLQIEKATEAFLGSQIERVLRHAEDCNPSDIDESLAPSQYRATYQCTRSDASLFNVILRLACGASAVAVIAETESTKPNVPVESLLGCISALDILEWLMEDLSLLNGLERFAIGSFPSFFCSPLVSPAGHGPNVSLLDAFVMAQTCSVHGALVNGGYEDQAFVVTAKVLSELFTYQDESNSSSFDQAIGLLRPLHALREHVPQGFESPCTTTTDNSIASVIQTMVSKRVHRVHVVENPGSVVVGVIRVTDVLRLLLTEQHRKPRFI